MCYGRFRGPFPLWNWTLLMPRLPSPLACSPPETGQERLQPAERPARYRQRPPYGQSECGCQRGRTPLSFCATYFLDTSLRPGSKWGMLALIAKALQASACGMVGNNYA